MEKAWQPRHDDKYHPQRRWVMKTVLVPARHFPPAIMWSPTLCVIFYFHTGRM
jgi:hypothetical protein